MKGKRKDLLIPVSLIFSMKCGFDVDGCLFDVLTPTLEEFNARKGVNISSLDIVKYNAHKFLKIDVKEFIDLLDHIWLNEFEKIKPYEPNVDKLFKKLCNDG